MTPRLANPNDIPAMHEVRCAVRENTLSNPNRITEADYVAAMDARGRTWVVECDQRIAAFATAYRDGSIWALFVRPHFEGRGFGNALHEVMLGWLWSLGHNRLSLSTEAGTRAETFYRARGWRTDGVLRGGELCFELDRDDVA
jgi:GNAT superfamily N-acetyltransferase